MSSDLEFIESLEVPWYPVKLEVAWSYPRPSE